MRLKGCSFIFLLLLCLGWVVFLPTPAVAFTHFLTISGLSEGKVYKCATQVITNNVQTINYTSFDVAQTQIYESLQVSLPYVGYHNLILRGLADETGGIKVQTISTYDITINFSSCSIDLSDSRNNNFYLYGLLLGGVFIFFMFKIFGG